MSTSNSSSNCPSKETSFELVIFALTIPLWTFITINLILFLIHYLRYLQYFRLYDRCTRKNAHFRYDFRLVVGKYSSNYARYDSHLIVDLLDNSLISNMTIQVPGTTIFNDNFIFTYSRSRGELRTVTFSIYKKHPIKDVKSIRIAHSCSNQDSRLFVFGLNLYDVSNSENKFFPITSIVKNRATQWALNTSFEAKNEFNFTKLGCETYDPFGISAWPTYMELVVIIFFIWCSTFFFGYIITVSSFSSNIPLHALTISSITAGFVALIGFLYLRFIKAHIIDEHYEAGFWLLTKTLTIAAIILTSVLFWSFALGQVNECKKASEDWLISSVSSGTLLTVLLIIIFLITRFRRMRLDKVALDESENNLMKTNSLPNIEFLPDENKAPAPQPNQPVKKSIASRKSFKTSSGSKHGSGSKKPPNKRNITEDRANKNRNNNEETLDNAFMNSDGSYIKTKNRNSISQYV